METIFQTWGCLDYKTQCEIIDDFAEINDIRMEDAEMAYYESGLCRETETEDFDLLFSDTFFKKVSNLNCYCVLFGDVGIWHGRCQIVPETFGDVQDAIMRGIAGCDEFEIFYDTEENDLEIRAHHHDGTNIFRIRPLTDEGNEYLDEHEEFEDDEAFKTKYTRPFVRPADKWEIQ